MDGWSADAGLLRQQLAAAERKLTQLSLVQRLPGAVPISYLLHRPCASGHSNCMQECAGYCLQLKAMRIDGNPNQIRIEAACMHSGMGTVGICC